MRSTEVGNAVPASKEVVANEAETALKLFRLEPEAWEEFNRLLDAAPREIPELRDLLHDRAPWESWALHSKARLHRICVKSQV